MEKTFDRHSQTVGNILQLEHINTQVPDQVVATDFYITGLGFTRDPFMNVGTNNMWVNVGRQQFHLPLGKPQVVRGHVGLVVPDLDALCQRLDQVRERLSGTAFDFERVNGEVIVTQPWGNSLRCYEPAGEFGAVSLGIPFVEFTVPRGTADGIARFYSEVLLTPAKAAVMESGAVTTVRAGAHQWLTFREVDRPQAAYDGHHIAMYLADFGRPHAWLKERGLVTEESNQHQFRFADLVDPATGQQLFRIEHEVRSLLHPMWGRTMINRNPSQSQAAYVAGRDAFYPEIPAAQLPPAV